MAQRINATNKYGVQGIVLCCAAADYDDSAAKMVPINI